MRTLYFVALTYGIGWLGIAAFALLDERWSARAAFYAATGAMLVPGLVALALQRFLHQEPVRQALGLRLAPNRWWLLAWLLPVALSLLALGAGLLVPGVELSPTLEGWFVRAARAVTPEELGSMQAWVDALPVHPFWIVLAEALVLGPTVGALFALFEELGWRGYLARALAPQGFWRASVLIGVVWGMWYAPLVMLGHRYPEHRLLGAAMMVLVAVLLSPLILWIRVRSRSVIAAAIFHGTLNVSAGLSVLVLAGGTDVTTGVWGLPGLALFALAAGLLAVLARPRLPDDLEPVARRAVPEQRPLV